MATPQFKSRGDMILPLAVGDLTRRSWYYGEQARLAEIANRSPKVISRLKGKQEAYIEIISEHYEEMFYPNAWFLLQAILNNQKVKVKRYVKREYLLVSARINSVGKRFRSLFTFDAAKVEDQVVDPEAEFKTTFADYLQGCFCQRFPPRRKQEVENGHLRSASSGR